MMCVAFSAALMALSAIEETWFRSAVIRLNSAAVAALA
jgi:hypothetical protein